MEGALGAKLGGVEALRQRDVFRLFSRDQTENPGTDRIVRVHRRLERVENHKADGEQISTELRDLKKRVESHDRRIYDRLDEHGTRLARIEGKIDGLTTAAALRKPNQTRTE